MELKRLNRETPTRVARLQSPQELVAIKEALGRELVRREQKRSTFTRLPGIHTLYELSRQGKEAQALDDMLDTAQQGINMALSKPGKPSKEHPFAMPLHGPAAARVFAKAIVGFDRPMEYKSVPFHPASQEIQTAVATMTTDIREQTPELHVLSMS